MNISITHKLFFAILAAAGLAVISLVFIMQWNLSRGFLRYVNSLERSSVSRLVSRLEQSYGEDRNWLSIQQTPAKWRELVKISLPEDSPASGPQRRAMESYRRVPPPVVRHFMQRLFLLDARKKPLIAEAPIPAGAELTPVHFDGTVVGYVGLLPRTNISDDHQRRFLREQKLAFIVVAGVVVLLAAGLSLLLARRLVKPIAELAKATDRLATGDFTIRVSAEANDELGRLAQDFNALAEVLAKNEQARRQWVADISHELRTPLAVLRGEIEALQDGIRQPSPETIASLHGEVLRLGRLVDDLYQLSLSDLSAMTYRKFDLDLSEVLSAAVAGYRQGFASKDITVRAGIPGQPVAFWGDRERLHQLFANLLDNALKYTNPGGTLQITMEKSAGCTVISFQDSPPGVTLAESEKLFERLYRVDSSRNRSTGGAGLGLAICRNIVEAHGGTITAQPSPLGGLWMRIELPGKGRRS
ncbi:sensor histidine kinase, HAMP domain-containing [Geotalea daltonii FRC-32]|uniref:histidine kinase n=1 Tax=Geotalea daltonii (strain DSM 22248 / JCM 15807 / FRC-32) TaxID=316067 RepID=B9M675_GEODF|nr:ATP-binding protein [Geotalea daltonii]ACM21863.1 sensor histidine kinase, HAMP domain-containing [Geotalea daltonii FRC-32]